MRRWAGFLTILAAGLSFAQEPARQTVPMTAPVQDKNFYLLSLLERSDQVREALKTDESLQQIHASKLNSLKSAAGCKPELSCLTHGLLWTEDDIGGVERSLRMVYRKSGLLQERVLRPMRSSGMFQRRSALGDEDLLAWAWRDAASGMNRAIQVYGEGGKPRYPDIDSVSYDVQSDNFKRLVHIIVTGLQEESSALELFFQPSLRFGLRLMEASRRDEAGRFEPMESGENKAAFEKIRSIRWTAYGYSAIVVPGSGTDRLTWNISQWGRERLRLAARRYRDGKAPFLIVSGGFVHPDQTPYAEAIEMKKALVSEFGVPADAIIVDPHARHTTTNLRNAARLMWRYGLPFDKPALITTDIYQSVYIESEEFHLRCDRELGYQPHELLARKSEFDLEFLPRVDSLHADPSDLLDP